MSQTPGAALDISLDSKAPDLEHAV
jgi:hypothetical protein